MGMIPVTPIDATNNYRYYMNSSTYNLLAIYMLTTLALFATIASPLVALWIHRQGAVKILPGSVRQKQYRNLDINKKAFIHFLKQYDKTIMILVFPLPFGYIFPHAIVPIFFLSVFIINRSMRKSYKKTHYIAASFVFVIFGSIGSILAHRGIVAYYDRFPVCESLDVRHELCRPGIFNILDVGAWLGAAGVI